jgi:hypothetical protein
MRFVSPAATGDQHLLLSAAGECCAVGITIRVVVSNLFSFHDICFFIFYFFSLFLVGTRVSHWLGCIVWLLTRLCVLKTSHRWYVWRRRGLYSRQMRRKKERERKKKKQTNPLYRLMQSFFFFFSILTTATARWVGQRRRWKIDCGWWSPWNKEIIELNY